MVKKRNLGNRIQTLSEAVIDCLRELMTTFPVEGIGADNGSEFVAKKVQNFLDDMKVPIYFYTAYDSLEKSVVERFNRTIKHYLNKVVYSINPDWSTYLGKIWRVYNDTPHQSIGKSPNEMTETDRLRYIQLQKEKGAEYLKVLSSFRKGDTVRVYRTADPTLTAVEQKEIKEFGKMTIPRFSKEIYRVEGIDGYKVKLKDLPMRFSPRDLLKVGNVEKRDIDVTSVSKEKKKAKAKRLAKEINRDVTEVLAHRYGKNGIEFLCKYANLPSSYYSSYKEVVEYNGLKALEDYIVSLPADEREEVLKVIF